MREYYQQETAFVSAFSCLELVIRGPDFSERNKVRKSKSYLRIGNASVQKYHAVKLKGEDLEEVGFEGVNVVRGCCQVARDEAERLERLRRFSPKASLLRCVVVTSRKENLVSE
jgi:hypothetical protein